MYTDYKIKAHQEQFLIDMEYKQEVKEELRQRLISELKNWGISRGFLFGQAVISLANGYWDDVKKDILRGRISTTEAKEICDQFLSHGVITLSQYNFYQGKFGF